MYREQMEIQDCLVKLVNQDKRDCLENLYVLELHLRVH